MIIITIHNFKEQKLFAHTSLTNAQWATLLSGRVKESYNTMQNFNYTFYYRALVRAGATGARAPAEICNGCRAPVLIRLQY